MRKPIVYILPADLAKLREIVHAGGNRIGCGHDFKRHFDLASCSSIEDKTCPICIHGFARMTAQPSAPLPQTLSYRLSLGGLDRGDNDIAVYKAARDAHAAANPDAAPLLMSECFVSWETYETLFDWKFVETLDELRDISRLRLLEGAGF